MTDAEVEQTATGSGSGRRVGQSLSVNVSLVVMTTDTTKHAIRRYAL